MKAAIIGCGTVGSGVAEILENKRELLASKCSGEETELKYILDIRDLSGSPFASKVIRDIDIIVNDPEVGVVIETMGGTEPAFAFCMKCLKAGKSVVTSNKELVANKSDELFAQARESNVAFMFEAAVCGGIPVINTMFSSLGANRINGLAGILNGTTNFILTEMIKEEKSFDDALKLAQKLGYAEKDPTADIEGLDACRKLCILSSIAFGTHFLPDEIPTEGITGIDIMDVMYARRSGYDIKLLGIAEKDENGRIFAFVGPMFVSKENLLYNISGVNNALELNGDSVGRVVLCGPGAGKEPTASAVVGDVLECVRSKKNGDHYYWEGHKECRVSDVDDYKTAFFVRGTSNDYMTAKEEIKNAFGHIRSIRRNLSSSSEYAFVTQAMTYKELKKLLDSIEHFTTKKIIKVRN